MIDRKIIEILACPASHRSLRPLPADRLEMLNKLVAAGQARYADGEKIEQPLEAALITDNEALIYRVDNDIPVLLVERGIPGRQIIDK